MSGKPYKPSNIDEHIGRRMQLRRLILGMSQKDLANVCGVTFQQIQKYESANNRISASRLFEVGVAMSTPVSFFFCGLPGNLPDETKTTKSMRVSDMQMDDPMGKNESLELVHKYWHLQSDEQRKYIMEIMDALYNGDKVVITKK